MASPMASFDGSEIQRIPSTFEEEDNAEATRTTRKTSVRNTEQCARSDFQRRIRNEELVSTVKGQTKQSKRIPLWLWLIIAKSLGIRLNPRDKPILAWILHLFTIVSAGVLFFTRIWFAGYDIASIHSSSDVLGGTVSVMMMILYIGLGVYSHRLAYRLFVHPKFLELMRLHSKTIIKLNAAVLVQIILIGFVVVQNISSASYIYARRENVTAELNNANLSSLIVLNPCQTVEIPLLICQTMYLSQVIFSFFFLLWNGMIATVIVSVARTHTIAIRRFICQLEIDAHLIDKKFRQHFYASGTAEAKDTLKNYLWLDSDKLKDVLESSDDPPSLSPQQQSQPEQETLSPQSRKSSRNQQLQSSEVLTNDVEVSERDIEEESPSGVFNSEVKLKLKEESFNDDEDNLRRRGRRNPFNIPSRRTVFGRFRRLTERLDTGDVDQDETDEDSAEPYILNDEEILYKHWKLSAATRFTSTALQRWTSAATITILLWSAVRIVSWLSIAPNVYDVLSFVLPILILPLIASSYAEVNFEGMKVLQSILPTIQRTSLFRYLYGMPIQMTVYGHPFTYGTMGTVLAAVVAAFLSKILLQEMNKIIDA